MVKFIKFATSPGRQIYINRALVTSIVPLDDMRSKIVMGMVSEIVLGVGEEVVARLEGRS